MTVGFLIKKGISFFLMPLTIAIMLGAMALWSLHKGHIKKAKRYLVVMMLWIAIITSAPISNLLISPLESQYNRLEQIPANVEYILFLGGDKERRAWEVLRLYQQMPNATIITSGDSLYDAESDAFKTARFLQEVGIKKENILMQEDAKDTKDEAQAIKKRIGTKPFLLVTSAYHMPRAMKLFQREGTNPIAAPGDFNHPEEDGMNSIFRSEHLEKTERALHEYLGLLWLFLT
ncbi:MAG: YdcF family protein [Cocleimonas sp.]|nr:YdcF family protein [Cocleimonas sp.]